MVVTIGNDNKNIATPVLYKIGIPYLEGRGLYSTNLIIIFQYYHKNIKKTVQKLRKKIQKSIGFLKKVLLLPKISQNQQTDFFLSII